jgi:hypothetical protein
LVKERSTAKKRVKVIKTELRRAGEALFRIGASLRKIEMVGSYTETPAYVLGELDQAPSICGLGPIRSLVAELDELEKALRDLNSRAASAGVD